MWHYALYAIMWSCALCSRPPVFVIKRRGFQTNWSCLSLPTVSPGSGSVSRCVRRGSGASICAGSPGTGLTGTGGGSPIRAEACLVICAEAEIAMLTTPVVGLWVGIDDRRQVMPDQHHGLSPRRRQIMFKMEPAPFPTEIGPHNAALHANSLNAF